MIPTLVLQKEVLDDLFVREDEFQPFIKFLKKNFRNYNLIINHNDSVELQQHSEENPIIELLLDKLLSITYLFDLDDVLSTDRIGNYCDQRTLILCNLNDADCNLK